MSRYETRTRAGGENGPVITLAKAATIVATGGRVTICSVDLEGTNTGYYARVSGGFPWAPRREPDISWASFPSQGYDGAFEQAACIKAAAEIAKDVSDGKASKLFEYVPTWAATGLAGLDYTGSELIQMATMRYHAGNCNYHDAWEAAVDDYKVKVHLEKTKDER